MIYLAYVSTFITVVAFAAYALYAGRMAACARDRRHLFRKEVGYNPFNCFFRPDLLSDEGLAYRKRASWAFIAFVASSGITVFLYSQS